MLHTWGSVCSLLLTSCLTTIRHLHRTCLSPRYISTSIILGLVCMHTGIYWAGCVRIVLCLISYLSCLTNVTITEQPKHTFFCLALTHCQLATPITHKSECYQRTDSERRATLPWCTRESPYQTLYNLVDSTASEKSRNCVFACAQPFLWRMWTAGAGCCCAMGP